MTDEPTTTVASSAPMTIRIHQIDKDADPDKPGLLGERETFDIVGNRHPDAVHGLGITRGVPVGMIDAWLEAMPEHREVFSKMTDEDLAKHADVHETFGWEPGLERAANDADNNKLAEQGTEPPNEDAPRARTGPGARPALGGPDAAPLPPEPTPAPHPMLTPTPTHTPAPYVPPPAAHEGA